MACDVLEGKQHKMVCPRCGATYSYLRSKRVGDRVYQYAVHYSGKGKERRARYCYLGPSGTYRYVEDLLGLDLGGLSSFDVVSVIEAAVDRLYSLKGRGTNLPLSRLESIVERIMGLIQRM
ncbi:MAG: hypothetical protein B9J98_02510 [Candidatus Terraquivivens tikiterensis]|uniref:Uncharacterized protein n=1 Tax=Candidatus Terraquivivens tikiterensis TaxID=1980982 RepID=A0A2R7Y8U7_9ARCH|nr:MAG: hypothetical protein B9J98_02510 [Candidatus Terraquivivens tikiterensis]